MNRSSVAPDRKSIRTSVMLPEGAHLQIQALADANQVSSAWIIRMAIHRFLDQHQGQLELPLMRSIGQGSNSND
ncbi:CopG family transcriptional regulator [Lysobacter sp. Root604]|uniref:ribbon-helix-helix domain-containing protein n=1 Tax=Lysobacter sp. Root604 TaxID=1736568 RepID=UPI001910DAA6|nr:CopG family transcriptional regulator [Lysobacter sp. Root604]